MLNSANTNNYNNRESKLNYYLLIKHEGVELSMSEFLYYKFIIAAYNETQARDLAQGADQQKNSILESFWTDSNKTKCELVGFPLIRSGDPYILSESFT